jgi:hypothetical protein
MKVTNNHSGPLGLPGGQELLSKVSTHVDGWDEIKENAVVKSWLKAGILVEDAPDAVVPVEVPAEVQTDAQAGTGDEKVDRSNFAQRRDGAYKSR